MIIRVSKKIINPLTPKRMIFIKQITTVEELWNTAGAPTGQTAVDAIVDYVKRVKSHSSYATAIIGSTRRRINANASSRMPRNSTLATRNPLRMKNDPFPTAP